MYDINAFIWPTATEMNSRFLMLLQVLLPQISFIIVRLSSQVHNTTVLFFVADDANVPENITTKGSAAAATWPYLEM